MDSILKLQVTKEDNLLTKSLIIVSEMFKDMYDKEGVPYINHLYYVCENVHSLNEKVVALLHDLIEDTAATLDDLREVGYPESIINSVKILTRDKTVPYSSYIDDIINSNDIVAIRVKKVDMKHNMKRERLNKLKEEEQQRLLTKYSLQYDKLENYLKVARIW